MSPGFYRSQQILGQIHRMWHTHRCAKCFNRLGNNFVAVGTCRIISNGEIVAGDNLILDSTGGRIIELRVGKDARLRIGNSVYINYGTSISCNIQVNIGNGCLIGPEVMIMDDDGHPVDWRTRHDYFPDGPQTRFGAPIILEDTVWLGARSIVLKGVTIGTGAVVAAGAVVTRSVSPRSLVAGVPARFIREL